MLADEVGGGQLHRVDVKGYRHVPGSQGSERIGVRTIQDAVPVGSPDGAEPGVEVVGRTLQRCQHDRRPALAVHRPPDGLQRSVVRGVETDHLAYGVHAAVGPPCTGQHHIGTKNPRQCPAEEAGDRRDAIVNGEPVERGPVVGDGSPDPHDGRAQTSSMRAIGALSPWRGPTFRIRV